MNFSKLVVNLTGLFFIVYGAAFAFMPAVLSQLITQSVPTTGAGLTDMRATYGGLSIAVGIMMFILAQHAITIRLGLMFVALSMMAMATTRTIGFLVDGAQNPIMYIYLIAEVLTAAWALTLLRQNRRDKIES